MATTEKIQWGDILARETRNAVDDVRHKVIEEGWYGKQTTGSLSEANNSNDLYGSPIIDASEQEQTVHNDDLTPQNEPASQGFYEQSHSADLYGENINNGEQEVEQEQEL